MKRLFLFLCCVVQLSCAQNNMIKANKLKDDASILLEAEDYEGVISKALEAKTVFEMNKDTLGTAESLYLMARASALLNKFENAMKYGEKAVVLCKLAENHPFELEYKLNNTLSWTYFTLNKDFSKILEHQKRQLHVVNQLDDDKAKASVFNNYGYDTTVSGTIALDSAITYMKFANNYYAKTENNNGRWYTLMNLTWQHRLKNDLEKSVYYGKLSVQQAKADNDRHAIIEANTNLGETLLYQNKLEEAAPYYEEGMNWSNQKDDRDKYVFDVYYSKYLWQKGEKETAVKLVKEAIEFLKTSEVFYEMLGRAFLANYYFQLKNYEEAEKQLDVFKNPRSTYISLESRTLSKITMAMLLSNENNKDGAMEVLNTTLKEIQQAGATQLLERIQKTKRIIQQE